jgi:hypothetical protein
VWRIVRRSGACPIIRGSSRARRSSPTTRRYVEQGTRHSNTPNWCRRLHGSPPPVYSWRERIQPYGSTRGTPAMSDHHQPPCPAFAPTRPRPEPRRRAPRPSHLAAATRMEPRLQRAVAAAAARGVTAERVAERDALCAAYPVLRGAVRASGGRGQGLLVDQDRRRRPAGQNTPAPPKPPASSPASHRAPRTRKSCCRWCRHSGPVEQARGTARGAARSVHQTQCAGGEDRRGPRDRAVGALRPLLHVELSSGCGVRGWGGSVQVILNKIFGYLPGRIASFVMNLHTFPKEIYLSRSDPPTLPAYRSSRRTCLGRSQASRPPATRGGRCGRQLLPRLSVLKVPSACRFVNVERTDCGRVLLPRLTGWSRCARRREASETAPAARNGWGRCEAVSAGSGHIAPCGRGLEAGM